jgi:hypothetical protein
MSPAKNSHFKELKPCEANRDPLSPISFLERAGSVYREGTSVVHGSTRFTWAQTAERCRRLASVLRSLNIKTGDVVSYKQICGSFLCLQNDLLCDFAHIAPYSFNLSTRDEMNKYRFIFSVSKCL